MSYTRHFDEGYTQGNYNDGEMIGVHGADLRPPPYSNCAPVMPVRPNPFQNLEFALGHHSKFSFVQLETVGFNAKTMMVQVHDVNYQPFMSISHTFGHNVMPAIEHHRHNHDFHAHVRSPPQPPVYIGSVTDVMSNFGQIIMQIKETERGTFIASSADVILGTFQEFSFFNSSISVKNSMGELLFRVVSSGGADLLYDLVTGEEPSQVQIGSVTRSPPELRVQLTTVNNLYINTRALALAVTFILYAKHHIDTACGCC